VRADRPAYINGDTINVTVNAAYYFGAPAPNVKVRYVVYSSDYWFSWARNEDFDFGLGDGEFAGTGYYYYGKEVLSRETTTDAGGNVVLRLPANIAQEDRSQMYVIEATGHRHLQPAGERPDAVIIHRGLFYIGAQPESWIATTGKPTSFEVQTVDTTGQTAGNVALTYTLNRVEWIRTTSTSTAKRLGWKRRRR